MTDKNTQSKNVTTYTTTTTQFVSSTNYNYTNGFLSSATVDTNGDGIADQSNYYKIVATFITSDAGSDGMPIDGTIDTIFSANFYPDGKRSESMIRYPIGDTDGDGLTDYEFLLQTDDRYGNMTGFFYGDRLSASGTQLKGQTVYTNTYDNQGNLVSQKIDNNADGTVDLITDYTYNPRGQQTSEYFYNPQTGKIFYQNCGLTMTMVI